MTVSLRISLALLAGLLTSWRTGAQSGTFEKVYSTFQTSCAFSSCHSHARASAGLDLEGAGNTQADKRHSVYATLYDKSPENAFAAAQGQKVVFPGDPYRSSLFRKAHGGIADGDLILDSKEGAPMPQGGVPLEAVEAERIRQWILFGAPETGEVVKDSLLEVYYSGKGIRAVSKRPTEPTTGKGFQIHLGPFFMAPTSVQNRAEVEYFSKYPTLLNKNIEVTRIEPYIGSGYSHHFILLKYTNNQDSKKPNGLRFSNSHLYTTIVSAHQDGKALELPAHTAFQWERGTVLDLNTHYINYSSTKVLACDVYLNVYTQPAGIAKQVMNTLLVPNTSLYVPNDGQSHTFSQEVFTPDDNNRLWIWGIGAHTHQYGTGYQIYRRNADGSLGDQVYDAQCKDGLPDCFSGNYDYQHPPVRFYDKLIPIMSGEGFIQKATYKNTGSKPATWGEKSTDEMMVMAVMYTLDTAGLYPPPPPAPKDTTVRDTTIRDTTIRDTTHTGIPNKAELQSLKLTINPMPIESHAWFRVEGELPAGATLEVLDIQGRRVQYVADMRSAIGSQGAWRFDRDGLPAGIYLYSLRAPGKAPLQGKLLLR